MYVLYHRFTGLAIIRVDYYTSEVEGLRDLLCAGSC